MTLDNGYSDKRTMGFCVCEAEPDRVLGYSTWSPADHGLCVCEVVVDEFSNMQILAETINV